jgi:XRE family aerobic/anaerobic benzoate catabolism transcriptional regulator
METIDDVRRQIGVKVRNARQAAGLSRRVLARHADVSERYLNQLEAGTANPSIVVLGKVCAALDLDLTYLVSPASAAKSNGAATAHKRHPAEKLAGRAAALFAKLTPHQQNEAYRMLVDRFVSPQPARRGLALLGLRGAGKSTLGQALAKRLGIKFVNLTRLIEEQAGMSATELVNLGGIEAYRALELEAVAAARGHGDPIVLETAGGIVTNRAAMTALQQNFWTVWLRATPQEHLTRVLRQGELRPMRNNPKALDNIENLLRLRERAYARADRMIDTSGRREAECLDALEQTARSLMMYGMSEVEQRA